MTHGPTTRTLTLGDAEITLIRDGELAVPTDELFKALPPGQRPDLPAAGEGQAVVPVHAVLVRVDGEVILFDTGLGQAPTAGGRGGGLLPALAALGVRPDDVTRVVISHTHADHLGGALPPPDPDGRPPFANARHHLPRGDWDWVQGMPGDDFAFFRQVLASLPNPTLDAPDDRVTPSVRSLAAPGHTPGHRCLLVESGGLGFCYLADLVHLPGPHFAAPDRVTGFDLQPALTPAARRAVAAAAVAGRWLLAAAHAPTLGRLEPAGPDAWTWRSVEG